MKSIRPPQPFTKPQPHPNLPIDGPSARLITMLESEAREHKEELARMLANFVTYLYEHSEPIL